MSLIIKKNISNEQSHFSEIKTFATNQTDRNLDLYLITAMILENLSGNELQFSNSIGMTPTERAIAKMYYRLVYVLKIKTLDEVPEEYRDILEEYRREVEPDGT